MRSFCGLWDPKTKALQIAGHWCVLSTRFDRIVQEGKVHRLHQEDFCQALGLPRSLKYERRGEGDRAFSARAAARILDATDAPALSKQRFLEATIFNLLIGNHDGHGKNHALLYPPGGFPKLAPFYDLLPTRIDRTLTDEFAFRIGTATTLDYADLR